MADIKLFKIDNGIEELPATLVSLERVTNINCLELLFLKVSIQHKMVVV